MAKLGVVSCAVPPEISGQALVLFRLLSDWDAKKYCLITSSLPENYEGSSSKTLKARHYYIKSRSRWRFKLVKLSQLINFISYFFYLPKKIQRLIRLIKQENLNCLLACSGDFTDIPAAFIAAKCSKIAFYIYMFDDYTTQWPWKLLNTMTEIFCKFFIKQAAQVIVPNESLARDYKNRYGINAMIIRNPVEINVNKLIELPKKFNDPIKIVYTGSVYHAHFDAFQNLTKVINENILNIELHIYTPQTKSVLDENGISGPKVFHHPQLPVEQIKSIQEEADVLFLPLAFSSCISEVITTSAPGKIGEYLSSGSPVLVHAPSHSFISTFFKEKKCGVVIDENNPSKLKEALLSMVQQPETLNEIINNAFLLAKNEFSVETSKNLFNKTFKNYASSCE